MKLHHVGIVVKSIKKKLPFYTDILRMKIVLDDIHDPIQHVNLCFLEGEDGHLVELIEPDGPDSPVRRALEKGGGLNHLCYEVDSIHEAVNDFREKGSLVVCEPVTAVAFNGRRVAFVVNPNLGIVEFVETRPGKAVWPV